MYVQYNVMCSDQIISLWRRVWHFTGKQSSIHDNDSLFVVEKPAWRPLSTQSTDRHILRGCLQVSTNNQLALDLHLPLDRFSVHLHLSWEIQLNQLKIFESFSVLLTTSTVISTTTSTIGFKTRFLLWRTPTIIGKLGLR